MHRRQGCGELPPLRVYILAGGHIEGCLQSVGHDTALLDPLEGTVADSVADGHMAHLPARHAERRALAAPPASRHRRRVACCGGVPDGAPRAPRGRRRAGATEARLGDARDLAWRRGWVAPETQRARAFPMLSRVVGGVGILAEGASAGSRRQRGAVSCAAGRGRAPPGDCRDDKQHSSYRLLWGREVTPSLVRINNYP